MLISIGHFGGHAVATSFSKDWPDIATNADPEDSSTIARTSSLASQNLWAGA
jgi:hypothetical protein